MAIHSDASRPADNPVLRKHAGQRLLYRMGALLAVAAILISLLERSGPESSGIVQVVWKWFNSSPSGVDEAALIGVSGVGVVVWTGGLVAFTLTKRYTADLSNGMWSLGFAFLAPLVALIASGAVLRTIALSTAIICGTVAVPQIGLHIKFARSKSRFKVTAAKIEEPSTQKSSNKPKKAMRSGEESISILMGDLLDRVIRGGITTGFVTIASLIIVVVASPTTVAVEALIALTTGLYLVYGFLTAKFRPDSQDGFFTTEK